MQGHLSAQEVFGSARRPLPGLNIATVHRTLATIAAGIFGVALVFGVALGVGYHRRAGGVVSLFQGKREPLLIGARVASASRLLMHIHFLDPYRPGCSPIHRLDPRVKLVLTLAFIATAAITPVGAWPGYVLLLSVILSVEILSGLGVVFVLKRAALALPFVLAALAVIFTIEGTILVSLPLGRWTLSPTAEGLAHFVSVALKSWLSVQAAIVLASSTPFPDLLQAMRAIRIPRLLVAMFGLMWRYLFVLADEAMRLMRARAARSGEIGRPGVRTGGSVIWRGRVTGGMAGNLFLRAFERSDRIYMAMVWRGYDGEARSLPLAAMAPGDQRTLAAGLVLTAVLLALGFLFRG